MHGTIGAGIMGNLFKCAEIQDILHLIIVLWMHVFVMALLEFRKFTIDCILKRNLMTF